MARPSSGQGQRPLGSISQGPYPSSRVMPPPQPSSNMLRLSNGNSSWNVPPTSQSLSNYLFGLPQQPPPPTSRTFPFSPTGSSSTSHLQQTNEPPLDMNEFPALGSSNVSNSISGSAANLPSSYASTIGTSTTPGGGTGSTSGGTSMPTQEFSPDDFPALSANSNASNNISSSLPSHQTSLLSSVQKEGDNSLNTTRSASPLNGKEDAKKKYGLIGLLGVIRMTDPDLSMLALGSDLTTLGLNLNSPDALYATFASPWVDSNQTAGLNIEPEYHLPTCYNVQPPPPAHQKIGSFSDETLFYIFYSMPRDFLQEAAAQELYNRNWRYHKELRLWLTKEQGSEPTAKTQAFERGTYIFFDPTAWEKVKKDAILMYESLEEKPMGGGMAAAAAAAAVGTIGTIGQQRSPAIGSQASLGGGIISQQTAAGNSMGAPMPPQQQQLQQQLAAQQQQIMGGFGGQGGIGSVGSTMNGQHFG